MEKKAVNYSRLKWIARALLLASALGIALCSYFLFSPRNTPFSFASPQLGQLLFLGGVTLAAAIFAWISPAAGGIVALLFGLVQISRGTIGGDFFSVLTLIPRWAFCTLYGLFIVGTLGNLVMGLKNKKKEAFVPTNRSKRILRIARIMAFVPMPLTVITLFWGDYYYFIQGILGIVPALLTLGLAWIFPGSGGFLMMCLSGFGSSLLFSSNWNIEIKWAYFILCIIFFVSGLLHVIFTIQNRKSREKES